MDAIRDGVKENKLGVKNGMEIYKENVQVVVV
jgi:hypothetical protein